jgi:hypothetical protein
MSSNDAAGVKDDMARANASPNGLWGYLMDMAGCAGQVRGLVKMLQILNVRDQIPIACIPNEITWEQAVRVVVTSLEKDPAHLHEDFDELAAAAIIAAWPCHK